MMQFGSTVLFVEDVSRVLSFYQEAFGFETKFFDEEFGFGVIEAGGSEIGFATHAAGERMMPGRFKPPSGGNPEGVEIAFYTSEVEAAFQKATAAGAAPLAEPGKMSWGQTVAYVRSLEGTVIGLCTPLDG
ncbi:MAG: VOC family protein [Verrucomicrobiota bacterium]